MEDDRFDPFSPREDKPPSEEWWLAVVGLLVIATVVAALFIAMWALS